jgi:hypothetical protein
MATIVTTTTRCDSCGAPAAYQRESHPGWVEPLCDECARFRGARELGEADLALDVLGFAIQAARHAGVTDAQLRAAFDMLLTGRHSSVSEYPCGVEGVLGSDRRADRPWQWSGQWAPADAGADAFELANWKIGGGA